MKQPDASTEKDQHQSLYANNGYIQHKSSHILSINWDESRGLENYDTKFEATLGSTYTETNHIYSVLYLIEPLRCLQRGYAIVNPEKVKEQSRVSLYAIYIHAETWNFGTKSDLYLYAAVILRPLLYNGLLGQYIGKLSKFGPFGQN